MENIVQVKDEAAETTVSAAIQAAEDEQLLEQYGVLVSAEYYNAT